MTTLFSTPSHLEESNARRTRYGRLFWTTLIAAAAVGLAGLLLW